MPPKDHAKPAKKKPEPGKELRCAYEHLGRVGVLVPLLGEPERKLAEALIEQAQSLHHAGRSPEAAELLRAAEHTCFAALAAQEGDTAGMPPALLEAITKEHHKLCQKADEHWGEGGKREAAVEHLYRKLRGDGEQRMKAKHYRAALELARAAEALAHTGKPAAKELPESGGKKRLLTAG